MAATRNGRSGAGPGSSAARSSQAPAPARSSRWYCAQASASSARPAGGPRPGGGGVLDGGPPGGDGVAEPSLDGLDQGEVAQAGPLDLLQPGRPGRDLPGAQMGLGGVQVAGPQLGCAQTGQRDRQRVAGHPGGAGVAQRRAGVQGRPAGGQDLVQVACAAGPQQPAGRQEQGEPGSPVAGQPALLLQGQLQGGLGLVVGDDPPGRPQQRQLGVEAGRLRRDAVQQLPQAGVLAAEQAASPVLGQQVGGALPVLHGHRLADGLGREPVRAVPVGGLAPQLGDLPRRLAPELVAQQLGEERVVAVLLAPVAERHHEDVGPLQPGQGPLAVVAAGEGVGQLAAELVHDRGPDQEVAQLGRQAVQDLGDQVAGQAAVVAGQLEHEPAWVGVAQHRHRGQAQPGRPALGAGLEHGQVGVGQPGPEVVAVQQLGHLGHAEGQVGGPELAQLAGDEQPVQRQGRVGPGDQHQPEPGRGVADQQLQPPQDLGVGELVDVVEHQHHRRGQLAEGLDERRRQPAVAGSATGGGSGGWSPAGRAPAPRRAAST